MQGNVIPISHRFGSAATDLSGVVGVPIHCQLVAVTASGEGEHDSTFDVGILSDTDGIIDGGDFGDDGVGSYSADDFNGALATAGQPYPLEPGDHIVWTVNNDGTDNGTIILWLAT